MQTSGGHHACKSSVRKQTIHTYISPHAAYHPRASSCFFSSRLQHFHCSATQLQRRQHTPIVGLQPFATGRELLCQLGSLTPHHSTKQYNKRRCCYRSSGKDAGRSSIDAIETKRCKQKPNTHTREHPTVTKLFWMGQGKLGRGTQQHKKAALQPTSE